MAAAAKSESIQVPGLKDTATLPRGNAIAIFIRGMDAFSSLSSDTVKLKGVEGDTVEARLVGVKPGRLYTLAQEFMSQAPSSMAQAQVAGGYSFQDFAFFKALESTYGKDGIYPTEPYTVLLVLIEMTTMIPLPPSR